LQLQKVFQNRLTDSVVKCGLEMSLFCRCSPRL